VIQFESGALQKKGNREPPGPKIRVLGMGGAGCSIISRISSRGWSHVSFVAVDSSIRTLNSCGEAEKLQLGGSTTRGWGTGGDREVARRFAEEAEEAIRSILSGVDLLFLVCGLGGGLGAGASPVVLKIAREMGCLSIGFFILPFYFEGKGKVASAREALVKLWQLIDGGVVISNDVLLRIDKAVSDNSLLSIEEAFTKIDEVFESLLGSIEYILYNPGIISLDFANIKSFLEKRGQIIISMGKGSGENFTQEAVEEVLYSSLWGRVSLKKAKGILLNIRTSKEFRLSHLEKIVLSLEKETNPSTPINFGVYPDDTLSEELLLTLMVSIAEVPELELEEAGKPYQQELEIYDEHDLDVPTFLRKQHG